MIHATAKVSDQVNGKCLLTRFYNFKPPTPSLSFQTPHRQYFEILLISYNCLALLITWPFCLWSTVSQRQLRSLYRSWCIKRVDSISLTSTVLGRISARSVCYWSCICCSSNWIMADSPTNFVLKAKCPIIVKSRSNPRPTLVVVWYCIIQGGPISKPDYYCNTFVYTAKLTVIIFGTYYAV